MSLLSMCQSVLVEAGWTKLLNIASSSDGTAQQIFELANLELQQLSERLDWPHCETDLDIPTVANQSIYALPDDFRTLVHNSVFNASQYYGVKGSVNAAEWRWRREGLLGSLDRYAFRLLRGIGDASVQLTPTPTGIENLVLTYNSSNYALDNSNVPKAAYTADSDVSRIPEKYVKLGLRWRFRRVKGMDYSAEYKEYEDTITNQFGKIIDAADIPVGGRRIDYDTTLTSGFVPDKGYGL